VAIASYAPSLRARESNSCQRSHRFTGRSRPQQVALGQVRGLRRAFHQALARREHVLPTADPDLEPRRDAVLLRTLPKPF
jgi:hypothetical protein